MPPHRPPFFASVSHRLLPALQLTRMALVFTAIADSGCTLLLRAEAQRQARGGASVWAQLDWRLVVATALIAIGLYGYGMSLNDIIDRRRDKQVAAHRPLPSGRLSVASAHLICFLLAMTALGAGIYYALHDGPGGTGGWKTLVLVLWTGALITFYDYAGKYLVAPGLLTLGLIRFFHALIPAPGIPLLWHALLLLNHITLLSAVAYAWEQKRPVLTRRHWGVVLGGLGVVDALAIAGVWWRRSGGGAIPFTQALWVNGGLIAPAAMAGLFILLALWIRRRSAGSRSAGSRSAESRSAGSREAGQAVMLIGLLWLIVYDAAFAAGYVSLAAGGILLLLLPVAWWAVRFMRWWSKVLTLSQRPTFKRVET